MTRTDLVSAQGDDAYAGAIELTKDLNNMLLYWGSRTDRGSQVIAELLRKWLEDLREKGIEIERARYIIDVVGA